MIWQMTNTPPKTWLMNIHLVLASKIHHTSNKTHSKSLNFLTSIAVRTKNNKAIKIFLLTSSARCHVFFVSIETVPKTHRPILCGNVRVGASATSTNLMTVTSNTASEHRTTLFIPDLC